MMESRLKHWGNKEVGIENEAQGPVLSSMGTILSELWGSLYSVGSLPIAADVAASRWWAS